MSERQAQTRHTPTTPSGGLVADVFAALERAGYHCPDGRAAGSAGFLLSDVIDAYIGRIDSMREPRTDHGTEGGGRS